MDYISHVQYPHALLIMDVNSINYTANLNRREFEPHQPLLAQSVVCNDAVDAWASPIKLPDWIPIPPLLNLSFNTNFVLGTLIKHRDLDLLDNQDHCIFRQPSAQFLAR